VPRLRALCSQGQPIDFQECLAEPVTHLMIQEKTGGEGQPIYFQECLAEPVTLSGGPMKRSPITGSAGCCPRAEIGQAAAAPMSEMNWRRRITRSPRRRRIFQI
jgi:hypothetical protein